MNELYHDENARVAVTPQEKAQVTQQVNQIAGVDATYEAPRAPSHLPTEFELKVHAPSDSPNQSFAYSVYDAESEKADHGSHFYQLIDKEDPLSSANYMK